MSNNPLKNIPLKTFRDYLEWNGLNRIRISGGHEIWGKKGLKRPVVLQTHKDPIPERIVRDTLRNIKQTPDNYIEFLKS